MATIVQATVDRVAKDAGMVKRSGSWYARGDETILVLNLQKSNYSASYYLNVAVWLLAVESADFPKENKCHIRTRMTQLVDDPGYLDRLLDVEWVTANDHGPELLKQLLDERICWIREATASLDALRGSNGITLRSKSLVTGEAAKVLRSTSE